jgi:hypothetical protein
LPHTAVTGNAFFIKDGFYLGVVINFFMGSSDRERGYYKKNDYSNDQDFFILEQAHQ